MTRINWEKVRKSSWWPFAGYIFNLAVAFSALLYAIDQGVDQDEKHEENLGTLTDIRSGIQNQINTLGLITSTAASQLEEQRKQSEIFTTLLSRLNSALYKPMLKVEYDSTVIEIKNKRYDRDSIEYMWDFDDTNKIHAIDRMIETGSPDKIDIQGQVRQITFDVTTSVRVTNIGNDVCYLYLYWGLQKQTMSHYLRRVLLDYDKYKDSIYLRFSSDDEPIGGGILWPGESAIIKSTHPLDANYSEPAILHYILVYEGMDDTMYDTYYIFYVDTESLTTTLRIYNDGRIAYSENITNWMKQIKRTKRYAFWRSYNQKEIKSIMRTVEKSKIREED